MKRSTAVLATLVVVAVVGFTLLQGMRRVDVAPTRDGSTRASRSQERLPVVKGGEGETHERLAPGGGPPRKLDLPPDFLDRAVGDETVRFALPDGSEASGTLTMIRRDSSGVLLIQGDLQAPEKGRFYFQRQTAEGVAGALAGNVLFDHGDVAWKVEPSGRGGSPQLVEAHPDEVICVNYAMPAAEQAPEAHPTDIPIPNYQTIIPLQSLPGATGVIYLDFDGEEGPFSGWGEFDAAAPGVSNEQVFEVWKMVCEDYQGFNLNITTDRKIFDDAQPGRRQHVVITPTSTASPGSGGIAYVGSYNWTSSTVCWAFYSIGKFCAEVVAHEVGHTLGLSHDGRTSPVEDYYYGHGTGETGWAPIMGAGYYENLTQWSKGEYLNANRTQDDLAIIVSNNNVAYRSDDAGDDLATARYLEVAPDDTISNEGIIETTSDVDAFRFVTTGGPVTINVHPVSDNPDLDILAELVDVASGDYLYSSNPDLSLSASISADLPAGEYILEISGTGRGDPLADGYSDYGSLGTYFISGSVAGGVKPDRFTVAEDISAGAPVGSVAPRLDHGDSVLAWTIVSGNSAGAFAIDPATGLVTVVNAAALDYESLSTRWDDPATVELQISIADASNPGLNESIRVVVTVTDLNEPPVMAGFSLTILERSRPGTALFTMSSSDPDRFDIPTYGIIAGNEDGWFTIDPGSGLVSVSGTGIGEVDSTTLIPLTIQVTDQSGSTDTAVVNLSVVDIPAGYVPGGVIRTYFEGIPGSSVTSLTNATAQWPDHPDSEEFLSSFDGGEHGDNFGSTLRGYFIPPVTGSYRFWISSDGSSQLLFDSSADQSGADAIASVSGGTDRYLWPDSTPYRSSMILLTAGKPYYIEALHKESTGDDHVAVAFSGPGISKRLLGGLYLAPYERNYAPRVAASLLAVAENAFVGQQVGTAVALDINAGDGHGSYAILAGNDGGVFSIDAASGLIRVASAGVLNAVAKPSYTLTVQVSDNASPALSGSGEITVNVLPAGSFPNNGIVQQLWTGIPGNSIPSLTGDSRYPYHPDAVRQLSSFASGEDLGDEYGSRIRAILTPPVSGNYVLSISSNEQGRLLLGSDGSAASATEVASVSGWTYPDEWTKYPAQQSESVYLVAGQDYYIETIQKEDAGSDHLKVGWTGPGITGLTVIPGSALRPFDINEPPSFATVPLEFSLNAGAVAGTAVGTVLAIDPEGESPILAITSGNTGTAFAIDPESGLLSVANAAALSVGQNLLTVSAQDRGIRGSYPLKTASVSVVVTVQGGNQAPSFPPQTIGESATQGVPFEGQLLADDPDQHDSLLFTKISGPAWLAVALDGSISGLPANASVGSNTFVVRVTDSRGLFTDIQFVIVVENVNDAPVFGTIPSLPSGIQGSAYAASLEGSALDVDEGDSVTYSKVAGPAWLTVGADGVLSGTPGNADVGNNTFTIRVTDSSDAFSEAQFEITVANINDPPVFLSPVITLPGATEDEAHLASIAGQAMDPDLGDTLTFAKISGPGWWSLAADGTSSGTPENADVGTNIFIVSVTDASGASAEAALSIEVINVNDAPVFHHDPVIGAAGREGDPYAGSVAAEANDDDAGDVIVFSKVAGPEWLQVAEDGSLSGTPAVGTAGVNSFTIRVSDVAGSFTEAALLIEVSAPGLPLPWSGGDVGGTVAEGSATHDEGIFTLSGAGELTGRNDNFQFVWQLLSGDGTITARVDSMQDTGPESRAGLMIRDSLASNSRHVFIGVDGESRIRWIRRTGFNGNTSTSSSGSATFPDAWLRLVRSGDVITSFKSSDGISWTEIGSLTASFPETCYFGLAVASGSTVLLNEVRFGNVSLSP